MGNGLTYTQLHERANELEARLAHLLQSDTVALFDEVNPRTGEYRRNIKMLDAAVPRGLFENGERIGAMPTEKLPERTKKQIKTVVCKLESNDDFDKCVNAAIAEGWTLVRREVLPPYEGETQVFYRALYAELEREVEA